MSRSFEVLGEISQVSTSTCWRASPYPPYARTVGTRLHPVVKGAALRSCATETSYSSSTTAELRHSGTSRAHTVRGHSVLPEVQAGARGSIRVEMVHCVRNS